MDIDYTCCKNLRNNPGHPSPGLIRQIGSGLITMQ